MTPKRKKITASIVMLFVLISCGIFFYLGNRDRNTYLNNKPVLYGIGTIVEFQRGAKVAPWFTYEFFYGEDKYIGKLPITSELRKLNNSVIQNRFIGRKFLVKFSLNKPKYNEMDITKPIPDSLLGCVKCNWEISPF